MNITERISKQMGGRIEEIINANQEIQIYYLDDGFAWRDDRKEETRDIDSQRGLSEKDLKQTLISKLL
ncbi:hypothetical protein T190115A13A_270050 [Tenacibaculum sp. 190524A02b]|uniref:Uncharacterized protein n=3 Tax=Tenacibaculum vairaonense TaxID=3137860 RepID=A0ABP1FAH3_9FLAO